MSRLEPVGYPYSISKQSSGVHTHTHTHTHTEGEGEGGRGRERERERCRCYSKTLHISAHTLIIHQKRGEKWVVLVSVSRWKTYSVISQD